MSGGIGDQMRHYYVSTSVFMVGINVAHFSNHTGCKIDQVLERKEKSLDELNVQREENRAEILNRGYSN